MLAQVGYSPPRGESPQRNFATMIMGMALIAIGAILINQGMNAVQTESALIVGVGLMAAGALFIFAGASKICPDNIWANIGLLVIGVLLLVASGPQLAKDLEKAVFGIGLTVVGIALIVVGVQVAKKGWGKYTERPDAETTLPKLSKL